MTASRALACLLAAACSDLPGIRANTCGNGAVDPGEDCDLYGGVASPAGHLCGAAEDPASACRWICPSDTACPSGWGCGEDGVCRRPSGAFVPAAEPQPVTYLDFTIGDVDGDGKSDLIGLTPQPDIDVFYGDGLGGFSGPDRVPALDGTRAGGVADIDGDLVLDVAAGAPGGGVIVARGEDDRSLATDLYPSFPFGEGPRALLGAVDTGAAGAFVVFVDEGPSTLVVAPELADTTVTLPIAWESLATPVRADLDDDGDEDLLVTGEGASSLWILVTEPSLDPPFQSVEVPLPAAPVDQALGGRRRAPVLHADADGDGERDLIVRVAADVAGDETVVALGLGGGAFAPAARDARFHALGFGDPFCPAPGATGEGPATMPLAAADFDGDGATDYAGENGIYLSVEDGGGPRHLCRVATAGAVWSEAVALDVNRDGAPDVLATDGFAPEVALHLGDGLGAFARFGVDLTRPAGGLRAGDFDGDRVSDVALYQATPDGTAEIVILFGQLQGGPVPVSMGRVGDIETFEPLRLAAPNGEVDLVDDLLVEWVDRTASTAPHEVAQVVGTTARRMLAPLFLPSTVAGVLLARLDGDTLADLFVVSPGEGSGALGFALTNGALGHFALSDSSGQPLCPTLPDLSVAGAILRAGDVLGDERDEILVVDPNAAPSSVVLLDARGEDFPVLSCTVLDDEELSDVAEALIGDVDGDGHADVVLAGLDVWILWSDGTALGPPQPVPLSGASIGLLQADTDPARELVAQDGLELLLLDVDAGRVFGTPRSVDRAPGAGAVIRAGDLDGDGLEDLVLSSPFGTRVLLTLPADPGGA